MRDAGKVEKKQGKEAELKRPLVKTIQQVDSPAFPSKARGEKRLPTVEREKEQQGKGGTSLGKPTSSQSTLCVCECV